MSRSPFLCARRVLGWAAACGFCGSAAAQSLPDKPPAPFPVDHSLVVGRRTTSPRWRFQPALWSVVDSAKRIEVYRIGRDGKPTQRVVPSARWVRQLRRVLPKPGDELVQARCIFSPGILIRFYRPPRSDQKNLPVSADMLLCFKCSEYVLVASDARPPRNADLLKRAADLDVFIPLVKQLYPRNAVIQALGKDGS